MISHAEVRAAVGAIQDYDYDLWTADEAEYLTDAVAWPGFQHHALFRITPLETSHPMSFFIARHTASGEHIVTSTSPSGIAKIVAREPELVRAADFAEQVYELLRPQGVDTTFLKPDSALPEHVTGATIPAPATVREDDSWVVRFAVLDEGRLKRWTVRLPERGVGTWTTNDLDNAGGAQ